MTSYVFLDGIPFLSGFALAVDVRLQFEVVQFPLQFAITLQTVRIETGITNGAAGFFMVRAIAKSALLRQLGNVGEGGIDALRICPQLQLAESRQIHEQPVAGHADELAMGSGVAALAVSLAHIGRALTGFAEQRVHDGRLSCAGRSDEGGGLTGFGGLGNRFQAPSLEGAERKDGDAGRMTLGEANDVCDVSAEIGFVQKDDGTRAALMREDEITLQTARVVIAIEPADDEEQVHVGGEDLLAEALARLLAGELGAAGQHLGDDGSLPQDDPVTHAWQILIEMAEMTTDGSGDFAVRRPYDAVFAVH